VNIFDQAQLLVVQVHLQKEFDNINSYDSDNASCYGAIYEDGSLILDEMSVLDSFVVKRTVEVVTWCPV
jgi:hypothetical protein